jgi:hypothetical protein
MCKEFSTLEEFVNKCANFENCDLDADFDV